MDNYAEYAVHKKLNARDRLPVILSVLVALAGFGVWTFVSGWVGPTILVIGVVLIIFTASRQELEYEYIFLSGDCEIAKIIKKSSRKQVYKFDVGTVQKVMPYTSIRFDNECQAHPDMLIRNFSSNLPDRQEDWYVFLTNGRNRTEAVVLELNKKCTEHVKYFYKEKYME